MISFCLNQDTDTLQQVSCVASSCVEIWKLQMFYELQWFYCGNRSRLTFIVLLGWVKKPKKCGDVRPIARKELLSELKSWSSPEHCPLHFLEGLRAHRGCEHCMAGSGGGWARYHQPEPYPAKMRKMIKIESWMVAKLFSLKVTHS